jgi:hypothetical protein
VKTFREKAKARPHIDRLLGAANVWYFGGRKEPGAVDMAKELKEAGFERFLWSSGGGAETVSALAAMPDVLVDATTATATSTIPNRWRRSG